MGIFIIDKIKNMKVDVPEIFKDWELEIESCMSTKDFCIRYSKYPKEPFSSSNWILISDNNVKMWKTVSGAKRYILNKMQFFTGERDEI